VQNLGKGSFKNGLNLKWSFFKPLGLNRNIEIVRKVRRRRDFTPSDGE